MTPQPAQRGGSAKSRTHIASLPTELPILRIILPRPSQSRLSPASVRRTSAQVPSNVPSSVSNAVPDIFDMELRALRRDRAFRCGPELFLHQRAFEDCLERLALIHRQFRAALLLGCQDPGWRGRLEQCVESVTVADPGPLFAEAAGGRSMVEDRWEPPARAYELVVAIGTLDTVNDLPRALRSLRVSLKPDSLLIGAVAGGDTLPQLRRAMHFADQAVGASSPHVHPRIEAASLAPLLTACGFVMPVVDVDRVPVSYESLDKLVTDLRSMGTTNILNGRSRAPLLRAARAAADAIFRSAGDASRTVETFEILHFATWTAAV
jgi:NADH dehydrogenase [ubiquinone] 1 alpha subcomplex assembly factor 5